MTVLTKPKEDKLEKMFERGWYEQLRPFLYSDAFKKIGKELVYQSKQLKEITPAFENTFRAFKECRWDQVHTVILGQDPYPGKILNNNYVADGLAFSSRLSQKAPSSLSYIFHAVQEDIKMNDYQVESYDLKRWASQGILLLNCALSLPLDKSHNHIMLWQPFIAHVLKIINSRKDSVAFALMGSYAKKYKPLLTNDTFAVYECEHPSAANHRSDRDWHHDQIFYKIDGFQKFKNGIFIKW